MGVVAPPASAGILRRILGVLIVIAAIVLALVLGWGIVNLIALPFGGIGVVAWFWGFLLVALVLGGLVFFGRRRQKTARAKAAEARAAQFKNADAPPRDQRPGGDRPGADQAVGRPPCRDVVRDGPVRG